MATHGSIGEFNPEKETWTSYTERIDEYFLANDVESPEKQRAILLSLSMWCLNIPEDQRSTCSREAKIKEFH